VDLDEILHGSGDIEDYLDSILKGSSSTVVADDKGSQGNLTKSANTGPYRKEYRPRCRFKLNCQDSARYSCRLTALAVSNNKNSWLM
jgi:hypothetical protein